MRAWLDVIDEAALDLEREILSRRSETASETGTDPDPDLVVCRHPAANRRGRLCLSCENTGFVKAKLADGEPVDPYLIDPPSRYGVVRDQSEASRRARDLAQLDAAIDSLERAARVREGRDVQEGETRAIRMMATASRSLGRDGRKVLAAVTWIKRSDPGTYRGILERDEVALGHLALVIHGSLRAP